jgi:hypothetical protein
MKKLQLMAAFAAAMLVSAPAFANHYSDLYVIPVVAHVPGAYGTSWMSDVAIQNFQSSPLNVEMIFVESGLGMMDNISPLITNDLDGSVTVPAFGSVLLKDVLEGYEGMTNPIGSLIIGADMPFAVTSRAYSMSPDGDTIGQTVRPSANFLNVTEGTIDPASAYIPGLIQNARFRSNLGIVVANATGFNSNLVVEVTVRNAAGQSLGTRNYIITPGSVAHQQFSVREITNASFDIGSAEYRITSGSGSVVAYASVIDNVTADAVFIMGNFPDNSSNSMGKGMLMQSPFRDLLNKFRTR